MQIKKPRIAATEEFCIDFPAPPCAMVVFGASGDLTRRKLIGAYFELFKRKLLSQEFYFLGCGRTAYSDQQFRALVKDILKSQTNDAVDTFLERIYYLSGDYNDPQMYRRLKDRLKELDGIYKQNGCHIFYLAVPPTVFVPAIENIGASGLACRNSKNPQLSCRVVIEKPFGQDIESASALNSLLHKHFDERQIYRIDHYLAKETVQNILMFRFGNSIFEPLWNRNYIDHIQITIAETVGIEHRAGFYEHAGAIRDIFQNHMLQLVSLTAMEPPTSFEADRIRDEKIRLLRSIRPIDPLNDIVSGQYGQGDIDGAPVPAYRQEQGVAADSRTETYTAAKIFIDNWRWKGIPFYLRTGKRLARKLSEVAVVFKKVPHSMFESSGIADLEANVLVFGIQPEEGISLSFQAKSPGAKTCISTLTMDFAYSDVFGVESPDAYQRVLLDCMQGDQTLFTRYDDVERAWELVTPILREWEKHSVEPKKYPAGSESFEEADALIASDGRNWRSLIKAT